MEGPGESIFLGAESLHLNANFQRQEEEEALEDQQRRNKELGNLLTNAFDDLCDDDDDGSIVSDDSHHLAPSYLVGGGDASLSEHYNHCYRTSPGTIDQRIDGIQGSGISQKEEKKYIGKADNLDQLQVLYEVRVREIERLSTEVEKWQRKSALSLAEKERLKISLAQQSNQISTSKTKIEDLERLVATLKQNVLNEEKSKKSLSHELQTLRVTTADLQSQLKTYQRGNLYDDTDARLRELQLTQQREMQVLQDKLDATSNHLALKTVEHDRLTRKLAEVTQEQESQLLAKSETIGQLSASLGATQLHVQQLQQQLHTGVNSNDLNVKLKEELERCIAGSRMKMEESKKLQEIVDCREETIKGLRDRDERNVIQINTYKDQAGQLLNECKRFQEKCSQLETLNEQLHESNSQLQQQVNQLQLAEEQQLPTAATNNEGTQEQITQLKAKLDSALAENDRVKESYVEVCSAKDQLLAALQAAHNAAAEKSNPGDGKRDERGEPAAKSSEELTRLNYEMKSLQTQVDIGQRKISELEAKVATEGHEKIKLIMRIDQLISEGHEEHSCEELATLENGTENNVKLQKIYDQRLEEEISKLRLEMKETEEIIKDEAMKIYADEFKSLQAKSDQVLQKWEQCERNRKDIEKELHIVQTKADRMLKLAEAKQNELQTECNNKVIQLQEAEKKFEKFHTSCIEEFNQLRNKYQANLNKVHSKYKSHKKTAEEYKRQAEAKDKHFANEWQRLEGSYRKALMELERRMGLLLQIT